MRQTLSVRLDIYVKPRAAATAVGGLYDGALVVRVVEPAERGKATAAALRAVAESLSIPASSVVLVRGGKSPRKIIDIEVRADDRSIKDRVDALCRSMR